MGNGWWAAQPRQLASTATTGAAATPHRGVAQRRCTPPAQPELARCGSRPWWGVYTRGTPPYPERHTQSPARGTHPRPPPRRRPPTPHPLLPGGTFSQIRAARVPHTRRWQTAGSPVAASGGARGYTPRRPHARTRPWQRRAPRRCCRLGPRTVGSAAPPTRKTAGRHGVAAAAPTVAAGGAGAPPPPQTAPPLGARRERIPARPSPPPPCTAARSPHLPPPPPSWGRLAPCGAPSRPLRPFPGARADARRRPARRQSSSPPPYGGSPAVVAACPPHTRGIPRSARGCRSPRAGNWPLTGERVRAPTIPRPRPPLPGVRAQRRGAGLLVLCWGQRGWVLLPTLGGEKNIKVSPGGDSPPYPTRTRHLATAPGRDAAAKSRPFPRPLPLFSPPPYLHLCHTVTFPPLHAPTCTLKVCLLLHSLFPWRSRRHPLPGGATADGQVAGGCC